MPWSVCSSQHDKSGTNGGTWQKVRTIGAALERTKSEFPRRRNEHSPEVDGAAVGEDAEMRVRAAQQAVGEARIVARVLVAGGDLHDLRIGGQRLGNVNAVLGALERRRVVVGVLHLHQHAQVGAELAFGAAVARLHHQAEALRQLEVERLAQRQLAAAGVDAEHAAGIHRQRVAHLAVFARVGVARVRGVDRSAKFHVLRHRDAHRWWVKLWCVVVNVLDGDIYLLNTKIHISC